MLMVKQRNVSAYMASTFVLIIAIGFYAYSRFILFGTGEDRYSIEAQFYSSNTVNPGGKVILSGIPVGVIKSINLNKKTFMSEVKMDINKNIHLPTDSQFVISSISMTDDGVIIIKPGKNRDFIKAGNKISNTVPYVSLEQQISNYIFGSISVASQ